MTQQISPEQLERYKATARKREEALRLQIGERRQRALIVARKASEILKRDFGASKVVAFGSMVQPTRFHLRSDIDLAVWDIHDYFRAVSRLLDLDPEFEFDLVPIEDAKPGIQAAISGEGIEL